MPKEYWWIRGSEKSVVNPTSYEFNGINPPSPCPGIGFICALKAPKDDSSPPRLVISETLFEEMLTALETQQESANVLFRDTD